jgi:GDP-L-fucose synthase
VDPKARIFVAGATGLVGSGIVRALRAASYHNLLTPSRRALDVRHRPAVDAFFRAERPEYVFVAAARVGGIAANDRYPADFIRDNLGIALNVIDSAYEHGATKLLFLGSSCLYPKHAVQPMTEDCLMTGPLEPTNAAYAVAKIAGIELTRAYRRQHGFNAIAAMPTNIYGPGDRYDLEASHVIPALITKLHRAKQQGEKTMTVWGSGAPRREFLHVDDLAAACVFLMQHYDGGQLINVGVGHDVSIAELARLLARIVGFEGEIVFDPSRPDGAPRKLLDVGRIHALGWRARIALEPGLIATYRSYCATLAAESLAG